MVFTLLQMHLNRLTAGFVPPPQHYGASSEEGWNVLLVHAHPLKDSYCAALADTAASAMQAQGHNVKVVSLNHYQNGKAMRADLDAAERARYMTGSPPSPYPAPSADVAPLVESMRKADALVFVYPTWWMSVPAILKGFVDRAFLPGIAFKLPHLEDGSEKPVMGLIPGLANIKKVGVITTYGASRTIVNLAGDGGNALIGRVLLYLFSPQCTLLWQGLYGMDTASEVKRKQFLHEVRVSYSKFCPPKPVSAAAVA